MIYYSYSPDHETCDFELKPNGDLQRSGWNEGETKAQRDQNLCQNSRANEDKYVNFMNPTDVQQKLQLHSTIKNGSYAGLQ